MNEGNRYDIPEEVSELIFEVDALRILRDCYVKRPFGYKKARRAAIDAEGRLCDFWKKVGKLYPELAVRKLTYNREDKTVGY